MYKVFFTYYFLAQKQHFEWKETVNQIKYFMKSSLFQYIVHLCRWGSAPVKANNEHSSYSTVITKIGKGIMRKGIAQIFLHFFFL